MQEIKLAGLVLAAVLVTKCEAEARAKPKVQPKCVTRTAAIQTVDVDGLETVTTIPYAECSDGARPADARMKPFCRLFGNPYEPTLYAERRDWRNLDFLCSTELDVVVR